MSQCPHVHCVVADAGDAVHGPGLPEQLVRDVVACVGIRQPAHIAVRRVWKKLGLFQECAKVIKVNIHGK